MSILNIAEVSRLTTLARATIYRLEKAGLFPRRIQISDNKVGWLLDEIDGWLLTRPRAIEGGLVMDCVEYKRPVRILTEKEVIDYTTIGRSNINRMIRAGTFPCPLKLSSHKIGWLKHEVDAWIRRRPRPLVIVTDSPPPTGPESEGSPLPPYS